MTDNCIEKTKKNKESAIATLDNFLNTLLTVDPSKANKISYWLRTYANYLNNEKSFLPENLPRYKRGDIIKVNFGFRLGSELGGLHYCIVLNNYDSRKSPTITVIPLSSLKAGTNISALPKDRVYLGSELSDKVHQKTDDLFNKWETVLDAAKESLGKGKMSDQDIAKISKQMSIAKKNANKVVAEFLKMKHGSVALIGQITTISKMRIYDPRNSSGILYGIRMSADKLDLINEKISELYLHKGTKKYTKK